ncbi:MAG TPA: hypothetical protein VD704_14170 [Gaiellaceae bacterium]|nr:hypothetical protein [Gaiellaceae bacterium]
MFWFTLWFMVILKIPALYLCYLIWWSTKDPPAASTGTAWGSLGGGGLPPRRRGPRAPVPGRRLGPHGSPDRRSRQESPVLAAARARRGL